MYDLAHGDCTLLVQTHVLTVGQQTSFIITKNFFKAYTIFRRSLGNHNKMTAKYKWKGNNHFCVSPSTKIYQSSLQLTHMEYEIMAVFCGSRKSSSSGILLSDSSQGYGLVGTEREDVRTGTPGRKELAPLPAHHPPTPPLPAKLYRAITELL